MASFNIEEGADTDPSWYGTFYKPGDQDWWDKGAHKALGQSFLRALVRQVAPELGTAEAGDLSTGYRSERTQHHQLRPVEGTERRHGLALRRSKVRRAPWVPVGLVF